MDVAVVYRNHKQGCYNGRACWETGKRCFLTASCSTFGSCGAPGCTAVILFFTLRRRFISCHAIYPHISSLALSAGSFHSQSIVIILQIAVDLGLCLLVQFKHSSFESPLNFAPHFWDLNMKQETLSIYFLGVSWKVEISIIPHFLYWMYQLELDGSEEWV